VPVVISLPSDAREWLQIAVLVLAGYSLLRTLARTPGRNAAHGIAALLGLYFLLKALGLHILAGLIEHTMRVGIIIVVVLFREEARSMLSRLGKHMRRLYTPAEQKIRAAPRAVEEIAAAVERLRAGGHGALIAVEMQDPLDNTAETGVSINGHLSAQLLEAVFQPTSPMHDGAVVVRGNTVLAAAAVLPLHPDSPELRRLGTRHRAALGLAAVTDAAVIVVSEERHSVKVARAGRFISVKNEHIRRELLSILTNEEEDIPDERQGRVARAFARIAVMAIRRGSDARPASPKA
jgi:diadenylate cyclase